MSKQTKSATLAKSAKPAQQTKPAKNAKQSSDEFIGEDSLSSGSSLYLKFNKPDTQFRIISKPISGWLDWIEDGDKKKPIRTTLAEGEPEASDEDNKPKKFVTFVVFDREDDAVKILELTQQSVIKAIRALASNPEWGNPFSYDINVKKTGEKMKTKYTVTPSPKKPMSKSDIQTCEETPCNLEALFAGEDPWDVDGADNVTEYFFK